MQVKRVTTDKVAVDCGVVNVNEIAALRQEVIQPQGQKNKGWGGRLICFGKRLSEFIRTGMMIFGMKCSKKNFSIKYNGNRENSNLVHGHIFGG